MHIAWTWIFAGGSLLGADGGIDVARIRRHVAARLFRFPRFRQRIVFTPVEGHPVWVDDDRFKLHYHVRHASLTEPGDDRRLQTTVSSIVSQPLDRSKPLWEMWVVEGLEAGRFAVVTKTHHCMVDGVSTIDLMTGLLDREPRGQPDEPVDWIPRPAPTGQELWLDSLRDRVGLAARLVQRLSGDVQEVRAASREVIRERLASWRDVVSASLSGAPATPINRPPGPHRFVSWLRLDLGEVRAAAERLHGSEDDVVLATVAGALWRLFRRAGFRLQRQSFRVVMPAAQHRDSDPGMLHNRASGWIVPLPVEEADARRRFRAVAKTTAGLSAANRTLGVERLLQAAEVGGGVVLQAGVDVSRRLHPYNLIVSRIPGPRERRWLLDAELAEAYAQVPLFENQSLGIAVSTYVGHLDIGVIADWEVMPDLGPFVTDLRESFAELAALHPVRK
jgi:WS/DGAT/MGAT family acyltransferase